MTTLYEYYNTGYDAVAGICTSNSAAQTFTVGATRHTVTSVWLQMVRIGYPGTLTVSIQATDVDGHPTGGDLTVGNTNADLFSATTPTWYEISVTEYQLSANTKYAIVCVSGGSAWTVWVAWYCDSTNPTYSGGNMETRDYVGQNVWITWPDDTMFEVWGKSLAAAAKPSSIVPLIMTRLEEDVI